MQVANLKEIRESGYIFEANRVFFHPLGLKLTINVDLDKDPEYLEATLLITDSREDPEGVIFDEITQEDIDKYNHVVTEWRTRSDARLAILGFIVQPLTEQDHE